MLILSIFSSGFVFLGFVLNNAPDRMLTPYDSERKKGASFKFKRFASGLFILGLFLGLILVVILSIVDWGLLRTCLFLPAYLVLVILAIYKRNALLSNPKFLVIDDVSWYVKIVYNICFLSSFSYMMNALS